MAYEPDLKNPFHLQRWETEMFSGASVQADYKRIVDAYSDFVLANWGRGKNCCTFTSEFLAQTGDLQRSLKYFHLVAVCIVPTTSTTSGEGLPGIPNKKGKI